MANNFTYDTTCKALWRFESGDLTADSKGNNTLTNSGGTSDVTIPKEGSGCLDLESSSSQYLSITDANLDNGFPLKYGDTTKEISVAFWFRAESSATNAFIVGKQGNTSNKRCFAVTFLSTNIIRLQLGYNSGVSLEVKDHASFLSNATWYYVSASYRNSDKKYAIRIRDTSGVKVGTDLVGTATLDVAGLNVSNIDWTIGQRDLSNYYDGKLDEMVVFSTYLTSDVVDLLSTGAYSVSPPPPTVTSEHPKNTLISMSQELPQVTSNLRTSLDAMDEAISTLNNQKAALEDQVMAAMASSSIVWINEKKDELNPSYSAITSGGFGTLNVTQWAIVNPVKPDGGVHYVIYDDLDVTSGAPSAGETQQYNRQIEFPIVYDHIHHTTGLDGSYGIDDRISALEDGRDLTLANEEQYTAILKISDKYSGYR
jgi:hypothetical protein